MDFDEVVIIAQEQVLQDLISGKNFRGLGTTAKLLVMWVATPADENAKALYGDKTTRTSEGYSELVEECQKQFVMDILGYNTHVDEHGQSRRMAITPQEAARNLVERVYTQYTDWARAGACEPQ